MDQKEIDQEPSKEVPGTAARPLFGEESSPTIGQKTTRPYRIGWRNAIGHPSNQKNDGTGPLPGDDVRPTMCLRRFDESFVACRRIVEPDPGSTGPGKAPPN
jgi:hypothetical protein